MTDYELIESDSHKRDAHADARQAVVSGAHGIRVHTEPHTGHGLSGDEQQRAAERHQPRWRNTHPRSDLRADGLDLSDRSHVFSKRDFVGA
jgi:hypothetical protein